MTEGDRLRSMLDERGVKWKEGAAEVAPYSETMWEHQGIKWSYIDGHEKSLIAYDGISPEQAIATTFGDERIEELEADWNAAKASASRWRERCVEYESRCYELESLLRDMYSQLRELGIEVDYE